MRRDVGRLSVALALSIGASLIAGCAAPARTSVVTLDPTPPAAPLEAEETEREDLPPGVFHRVLAGQTLHANAAAWMV